MTHADFIFPTAKLGNSGAIYNDFFVTCKQGVVIRCLTDSSVFYTLTGLEMIIICRHPVGEKFGLPAKTCDRKNVAIVGPSRSDEIHFPKDNAAK